MFFIFLEEKGIYYYIFDGSINGSLSTSCRSSKSPTRFWKIIHMDENHY